MNDRRKVFVSYASADEQVARRIVECLEGKQRSQIWFDKNEIVWGDNVIQEINSGLADSLMGIVILSDNFFNRAIPQLELNTMIYLMNTVHFRILPLFHNFSHTDLESRYPLLISIRGENADEDCDSINSKFDKALTKTMRILNVSQETPISTLSTSNVNNDPNAEDVDPSELRNIFDDLRNATSANRKSAIITKLRHYSEKKKIWKHDVSWDIISYLISSKDNSQIKDGLYVLENMIRIAGKLNKIEHEHVKELTREGFGSQLITLSYSTQDQRISFDSFIILKEVTSEETLSKYAVEAIRIAMREIENDNDYTRYIQKYVAYFEKASKNSIKMLCDSMYALTLTDDKLGERARNLYEYFIRIC